MIGRYQTPVFGICCAQPGTRAPRLELLHQSGLKFCSLSTNFLCHGARFGGFGIRSGQERKDASRLSKCTAAARPVDVDARLPSTRAASMQEYKELKKYLLQRTQRGGIALTLYLLVVLSGQAALCCMLGSAFAYGYVWWLCHDIDAITAQDDILIRRADAMQDGILKNIARAAAGLAQQAQPRLLVPVALAASLSAFNRFAAEPLGIAEQASAMAGFLSFKLAHVQLLFRELGPGSQAPEQLVRGRRRPAAEALIPDDGMDIYGRKVVQPKAIEEADRVLAEEEARKQGKAGP